jgi:hypothetical protein
MYKTAYILRKFVPLESFKAKVHQAGFFEATAHVISGKVVCEVGNVRIVPYNDGVFYLIGDAI